MEIYRTEGIRLSLASIGRTVKAGDGTSKAATYREGDPEFDAYVAERTAEKKTIVTSTMPKGLIVGLNDIRTRDLQARMDRAFDQYYAGTMDKHALESTLSDVVGGMRSEYAQRGHDPDEFMPLLLRNVYDRARIDNITSAYTQTFKDSRALASYYNGHDENSRDVVCYDAKYYYQSEDMKNELVDMMQRIGQKYGVTDVELPTDYPDGDIRKSIYSSYNTIVNEHARNIFQAGNMLDENMVPPEDFKFFYKGNETGTNNYKGLPSADRTPEAAFDGVLHARYGRWSFVGRVPVQQAQTGPSGSVNMYEHISQNIEDIPQEIVPILKNFDFFTVHQRETYTKTHPRQF